MILRSLLSKAQIHWILGFVHGSIFYCFHSNVRSPGCNICQRLDAIDLMLIANGGRSVKELGQMPYLRVYLPVCPSLSAGL